jgi:hypothetical protein
MSIDVDALQEMPATEAALDEWCCFDWNSISSVITCFGCTVTG